LTYKRNALACKTATAGCPEQGWEDWANKPPKSRETKKMQIKKRVISDFFSVFKSKLNPCPYPQNGIS